jgi:hypothetical protein
MTETIYIPDLFASLITKISAQVGFTVYFDHGHYDAVNKNLVYKDKSIDNKDKYPLIWLVEPFDQRTASNQDYNCELSGLDILILMGTNADDSIDERKTKYFTPKLWPVARALKKQMVDSGLFQLLSDESIPYDYMKDWYYQSGLSGKNNLFNDIIDAVQIKNLRLRVNPTVTGTRLLN